MIHLELAGAHTRLCSTLCGQCPQGSTGCCVSPPAVDWSDIGRIVLLGGRDWLLAEVASGNLIRGADGLRTRLVRKRTSSADPRRARCVYHGPEGCSIAPSRRSATCNYFLCEDTFLEGGERKGDPDALAARRAHAALRAHYSRWTEHLAGRVRSLWPDGPPWDAPFLDWVGAELDAISNGMREPLELTAPRLGRSIFIKPPA